MDPIERWYASDKPTTNYDRSGLTREELIKHIRDKQYERGSARGIACPLPPDLDQRTKDDLIKLAAHWYY
jgi:hypothetical protein